MMEMILSSLLVSLLCFIVVFSRESKHDYISAIESGGFITDIPDDEWKLKIAIHCNESKIELQHGKLVTKKYYDEENQIKEYFWPYFWQANYEPTWACGFERRIGHRSEGGKWVCDPHRIDPKNCLLYSFGSYEVFDFEVGVYDNIGGCVIHTFDPFHKGINTPPYVKYHQIGLHKKTFQDKQNYTFQSFHDTIVNLNHKNRVIDILKVDIEFAEFEIFTPKLFLDMKSVNVTIRQILLEIHCRRNLGRIRQLFGTLHDHNYVIFHREPNLIATPRGSNKTAFIEYSFLLIEKLPDCKLIYKI